VLFIALNVRLTRWRGRVITARATRLLEAVVASVVVTAILFWVPAFAPCRAATDLPFSLLPDAQMLAGPRCAALTYCGARGGSGGSGGSGRSLEEAEALLEGGSVSVLASLLLQPLDHLVRILFHTAGPLPLPELLAAGVVLFATSCFAYGLHVPSGMFVPAICIGACFGRLAAELERLALGPGVEVDGNGLALLGGAAFLAAITRAPLSAAVILVETTSHITFAPPIVIAVLIATAVGDRFGPGLYDAHLELQRVAFLRDSLPHHLRHLRAGDMASSPPLWVQQVVSVRELLLLLAGCEHSGFPVTNTPTPNDGGGPRKFLGLVTREQLLVLLRHRAFLPPPPTVRPSGGDGTVGAARPSSDRRTLAR
jgi:hypothetical protein